MSRMALRASRRRCPLRSRARAPRRRSPPGTRWCRRSRSRSSPAADRQGGVNVHRVIEAPLRLQVATREHQVADAAVVEAERAPEDESSVEECARALRQLWRRLPGPRPLPASPPRLTLKAGGERGDRGASDPSGSRRSSSAISAGGHVRSSAATREAFFLKSDGPRASPRKRRTSPVDAPSS